MTYLISLFGWETSWPVLFRNDFKEAKAIVERVVAAQGVPENAVGYCVTSFDAKGSPLEDIFYQCEESPFENAKWRAPGEATWNWDKEPVRAQAREDLEWWSRFVSDAGLT